MKLGVCVIGALAMGAAAAPEAGHPAWRWEQAVSVPAAGVVRLEVPPATLNEAQATLADLRLLSPDGVETPWLLDNPAPPTPAVREAASPEIRMIEAGPGLEAATQIEFATATDLPIEAVTLRSPAREFIKSVTIEATGDGENWEVLGSREVIFRQPNGPERLRLPLAPKAWRKLRLKVSDARTKPVPITSAEISLAVPERRETVAQAVRVLESTAGPTATELVLDLGAANLLVESIRLDVTDPVFSRRCTVSGPHQGRHGEAAAAILAGGVLYRVPGEQGAVTEQLAIPLNRRVATRHLTLRIENGDSPPLTVTGAGAARCPTTLEFHAAKAGDWTLLVGNAKAAAPAYDLGPLRAALAGAPGQRLSPGELRAKADFQPPPPVPGVDPVGVAIDLAPWSYRAMVREPAAGVISLELAPLQLAHAREDLGDLRLVQNGRQLPYLIAGRGTRRTLPCGLAAAGDPARRPTVSRWEIRPPVVGLPAARLRLASPTPVFSRTLRVCFEDHERHTGGCLVSADWTRTGTTGAADLEVDLSAIRMPERFWVETDNGDNPPLGLSGAELVYHAAVLTAKLVAAEPVYLYYGNPRATAPSYDLGLVRDELLAAEMRPVTTGPEEILRPENARRPWSASAGSPWLWAALALVVVILLAVVAKLLPATAPPPV